MKIEISTILVSRGRAPFGQHQDAILGADQKERGLWRREWISTESDKHRSSIRPAFACILINEAFLLFPVSVSFSYDLLRQMEDRDVLKLS